jgi:hypothetical protein
LLVEFLAVTGELERADELRKEARSILDSYGKLLERMSDQAAWCEVRRMMDAGMAMPADSVDERIRLWTALTVAEQKKRMGPKLERPYVTTPADPYRGALVPRPVTPLPSRLTAAVGEAPLITELTAVARQAVDTQVRLADSHQWELAVLAGLVCPTRFGLLEGSALRALTGSDRDALIAVWRRIFRTCLNQLLSAGVQAEVVLALFETHKAKKVGLAGVAARGERVRLAFEELAAIGAVRIDSDVMTLTSLGVNGLFDLVGWADKVPWTVDAGEWSPELDGADLSAVLTAAAESRLDKGYNLFDRWVAAADREVLAGQVVEAFAEVSGLARIMGFEFLVRIGPAAEPAVRRLAESGLAGWGWFWAGIHGLKSPREVSEQEMRTVVTEVTTATTDLRTELAATKDLHGSAELPGRIRETWPEPDQATLGLLTETVGRAGPVDPDGRQKLLEFLEQLEAGLVGLLD